MGWHLQSWVMPMLEGVLRICKTGCTEAGLYILRTADAPTSKLLPSTAITAGIALAESASVVVEQSQDQRTAWSDDSTENGLGKK